MAKQEQKLKITFEIEIYAIDTAIAVKQKIRKELTRLVNEIFDNYFGFRRVSNRNIPNLDSNIDRQHLRYRAIVDENKTIYRK